MKISLFYKLLTAKASIFGVIFVILASIPLQTNAGFFSNLASIFTGGQAQAYEKEVPLADGFIHNSQTIPLLTASIDPDMKNLKDSPVVTIVGEEALSSTDFFIGKGIENISSGGIIVYTVKKGDTLSEIAEEFDISTNTIRWENNISGQKIRIGQKLNILPVTGVRHIISKGDTLSGIAVKYDAEIEDILIFNGLSKIDILKRGEKLIIPNGVIKAVVFYSKSSSSSIKTSSSFSVQSGYYIRPAIGRITSPYGSRRAGFHYGVDIGNKRGTSIVAAASGKVIKVVNYCKEGRSSCGGRYGNYITIQHANGTKTRYAHLGSVLVSTGQQVSQGQLIGKMGNTGRSTGPHLHFEVIKNNGSTMKPPVY